MKFIFEIKIREGHTNKQYINAWKKGSALIQKSKSAQGTILYQNTNDPTSLLAIATWRSKKERDLAMKRLHQEARIERAITEHRKHGIITVMGNFEEIAEIKPK